MMMAMATNIILMRNKTTMNNTLTRIKGIKVGHVTDIDGVTGCTVILCPPHTVGAVDVRGGAPGTRETDLLQPHNHVEEVTAIVLSGGSAFGLATADGVMRWHDERQIGYKSGTGFIVPIVPAAILFDLTVGTVGVRPTAETGYQACENATSEPVQQGSVGAGTGASVGKMFGIDRASKGGIGSATVELDNGLIISALMAVNAVGDIIDEHGQILAGIRAEDGTGFVATLNVMTAMLTAESPSGSRENTVIGVVATNAKLSKAHTYKVTQMAHDGIARAVNPSHTMFDGDTIFALSTGEIPSDPTIVGAYAAEVVTQAIRNAVRQARSLGGIRAIND
jgi:L-aminopeptidase/D-esterase-like protein